MNFCDAHLHSTHPPLLSAGDLQPEGFFFSCAAGPDDWEALLKAPGIKPFLGIHPEKIGHDWSGRISGLRRLLRDNPAAGVGECGLDGRFYKTLPRKLQEEVLAAQIGLAAEFSRPAALHQVGAPGALADLLGSLSEVRAGSVKLMIHGFKDSPEILKRYLDLGLYISLGPGGHWEKEEFLKTASLIPGDRLLLETDWPYCPAAGTSSSPSAATSARISAATVCPTADSQPEDEAYKSCLKSHYTRVSRALGIDIHRLAGLVKRNGTLFTN